jgi:hypothetical protein
MAVDIIHHDQSPSPTNPRPEKSRDRIVEVEVSFFCSLCKKSVSTPTFSFYSALKATFNFKIRLARHEFI